LNPLDFAYFFLSHRAWAEYADAFMIKIVAYIFSLEYAKNCFNSFNSFNSFN